MLISLDFSEFSPLTIRPNIKQRRFEGAWFAAIKGSSLDRPPPARNAYTMAKAGE